MSCNCEILLLFPACAIEVQHINENTTKKLVVDSWFMGHWFWWLLRESLPKTGPLRFGSEIRFPLNFAHEYILVQK